MFWFAIMIAGVMIFARLGALPLRDPDEGRNTQVALEMKESGVWLTPTYNGIVYLDKPAFFFKAVAISMAIFGNSETAARLPSVLFAVGILAMVYGFCRREYDQTTGALAVIIVSTTPSFFALARHVIFDMTLAFFVCGAIFSGYYAEATDGNRRRNRYLLGAACTGLATLVKGPVGFIVPVLALSAFNIADKKPAWWKRLFHPLNFLVFLAITLPWFFGLWKQHPDFAHYGLVEESFNRFTTGSFRRRAPFYYYGLIVLGGLFAWSVLLPESMQKAWKNRSQWTRADRFLIVWAVTVCVFFSISKSKLPHYILSALVALGIQTARLFAAACRNPDGSEARLIFRGLTFLAILCAGLASFLVFNVALPDAHRTIFKIKSVEFERVAVIFGPAACLLLFVAIAGLIARWRRDPRLAFATFLIIPLTFVTIAFPTLVRYSEASSARALAKLVPPGADIVCLLSFPCGLPYYTGRPVTLFSLDGSEMTSNYITYSLRKASAWPPQIVPLGQHEEWLKSRSGAVFILGSNEAKSNLEIIAARYHKSVSPLTTGWWGVLLPGGN